MTAPASCVAQIAPAAPAPLPLDPGAVLDVEALLQGLRGLGIDTRICHRQAEERAQRILAGECPEDDRR